jgi:nicotinate-nucleotide pyrophosphorylase (carboxylating)
MIMLKDNHIDYAGGIEKAIDKAWQYVQTKKPELKIEVETRNIDDVKKVVAVGKEKVFRILLDNFSPQQITEALNIIQDDFETEASGGINLDNIELYAATGATYISVGGLIHQAQSVDLSLKAVIVN